MKHYDLSTGIFKGAKYAIIGLISLLVYQLPILYPELAQVTLIGALSFLANYLKVKWNLNLP